MIGSEDYYLGWVIQPLNVFGTLWSVYERNDTIRPKYYIVEGSKGDCLRFIESKLKRNRGLI